MLPNAIIIGVQKSGTTMIYEWLSQHPAIFGEPSMKEYNFFNNPENLSLGLSWFEKSFSKNHGEKICLHGYVKYIDDLENLVKETSKFNKNCKFILSLRSPIERCYSAYWEGKKNSKVTSLTFRDEVLAGKNKNGYYNVNEESLCIKDSFYSQKIEKLKELVDDKNLIILNFNNITTNPENYFSEVFNFLGVDDSFVPKFDKVNEAGVARSLYLQKLLQRVRAPLFLKKYTSGLFLSKLKATTIRKINVKKVKYPTMDDDVKKSLEIYFEKEIDDIKALTGFDFKNC